MQGLGGRDGLPEEPGLDGIPPGPVLSGLSGPLPPGQLDLFEPPTALLQFRLSY